jgi:hypothetical protein
MYAARRSWVASALMVACASHQPPEPAPPRVCLADAELERFVARSQPRTGASFMNKLDPRLRIRLADLVAATDDVCIEPVIVVLVAFTGPVDDLRAVGFELVSSGRGPAPNGQWIGDGRIAPSRLVELAAIPHVVSIAGPDRLDPELDGPD